MGDKILLETTVVTVVTAATQARRRVVGERRDMHMHMDMYMHMCMYTRASCSGNGEILRWWAESLPHARCSPLADCARIPIPAPSKRSFGADCISVNHLRLPTGCHKEHGLNTPGQAAGVSGGLDAR